jgi:hypothetical protein
MTTERHFGIGAPNIAEDDPADDWRVVLGERECGHFSTGASILSGPPESVWFLLFVTKGQCKLAPSLVGMGGSGIVSVKFGYLNEVRARPSLVIE